MASNCLEHKLEVLAKPDIRAFIRKAIRPCLNHPFISETFNLLHPINIQCKFTNSPLKLGYTVILDQVDFYVVVLLFFGLLSHFALYIFIKFGNKLSQP